MHFKKLAGTSAVFVLADLAGPSPVERDGMVWSSDELHVNELPDVYLEKEAMASPLALEGLEDYDPPSHGDQRRVESMKRNFVYNQTAKAWIQCAE